MSFVDFLVDRVRAAAKVAAEHPTVRRGVQTAQARYGEIRREVEARIAEIEAELWEKIGELQNEARFHERQWRRRTAADEHYRTLGIPQGATLAEVKAAWRAQMRKHHPDRHAHDPAAEARAHNKTQAINHAYTELVALLTGRESRRA